MSVEKKADSQGIKAHKMPDQSVFYDKVMPIAFVVLAVIMAVLILFAIGVLTGIVPWI